MFCCSVAQLSLTLWDFVHYSTPSFPDFHYRLELAQTHVHWVSDAIQPSQPLLSPSPPAFSLSQHQGLFQWADSSYQVTKALELQHPVLPVNIQDWFPLGLTGLIFSPRDSPESSPKSSILQHSASFMVKLSQPFLATGKTIALTGWMFVCTVMSLLFNKLSRFVIAFLPRNKCHLIS